MGWVGNGGETRHLLIIVRPNAKRLKANHYTSETARSRRAKVDLRLSSAQPVHCSCSAILRPHNAGYTDLSITTASIACDPSGICVLFPGPFGAVRKMCTAQPYSSIFDVTSIVETRQQQKPWTFCIKTYWIAPTANLVCQDQKRLRNTQTRCD